jgi:hypothetical protein
MPEYKSERREQKRRNARKMGVSGRSVFLLVELSSRPPKWRRKPRHVAEDDPRVGMVHPYMEGDF